LPFASRCRPRAFRDHKGENTAGRECSGRGNDRRCGPFPAVLAPEVVKIEAPELCHRFTARIIRNVKIGPSPDWLVKRLEAVGERSINNVADITNYVMLELGQPMHAFDLDKLAEGRIVVRTARPGETITTLDEVERKLDETMLAICDAEKPAAVAGIMGGIASGITEQTTNVLLEVAYFKRENIRQTSRKLGLSTEASYRFERGVDVENIERASNRATELIRELAGGEPADFIDVWPQRTKPNVVASADISRAVKRLTGLDVAEDKCLRILNDLGIKEKEQTEWAASRTFVSPTWRHDIAIEEDLVEEVARHAGYENIADELPPAYGAGEYQPGEESKMLIRRVLADQGFDEAIAYSFIDTKFDEKVEPVPGMIDRDLGQPYVTLRDSVIEGAVRMRPTLIPGLLDAARLNLNYQRRDLKLFEIGKAFAAVHTPGSLPNERELLALVLTGGEVSEGRGMPLRDLDFYDAKGAFESALAAVGHGSAGFEASDVKHLRPGQAASGTVNGNSIGTIGRLSEEIAADYKFKQPVYVAEIDLQALLAAAPQPPVYRPLPRYPAVVRDVSFLVKREVTFAGAREAAFNAETNILRSVQLRRSL
jgi:phenylalanyl-tRNA synthetase beta chain